MGRHLVRFAGPGITASAQELEVTLDNGHIGQPIVQGEQALADTLVVTLGCDGDGFDLDFAVAFREGDLWVAQGIEYDIAVHAPDLEGLSRALSRAVAENAFISQHLGRKPMEGIGPAPDRFRELFEAAALELRPVRPAAMPPEIADIELRLLERA